MEEGLGGILDGVAIRTPRLEDAGLEDCALPPESIMEAFSRAAISIKSRLAGGDDDEGDSGCVQDPSPSNGELPDALVTGEAREATPPPICGAGAGGGSEEERGKGGQDEVVVVGAGGGDLASDRVLVLGEEGAEEAEGKRSCVGDEEEGFVGGEKKKKGHDEVEEAEGEGDSGRPILVEDLI